MLPTSKQPSQSSKLLGSGQSLWLSVTMLAMDESGHRSMGEAELLGPVLVLKVAGAFAATG
jgi:hypothetical protein